MNTEKSFAKLFANLYALYLKTQNYHWHVVGPHFKQLHQLFEEQYMLLGKTIDSVAERMVTLEFVVPANFTPILELRTMRDGNHKLSGHEMVIDLKHDHDVLLKDLYDVFKHVSKDGDEGSIEFITGLMLEIEKVIWILRATSVQKI